MARTNEEKIIQHNQHVMDSLGSTYDVFSRVEKQQKWVRLKRGLRWLWYTVTFRGHKNVKQKITKGRLP